MHEVLFEEHGFAQICATTGARHTCSAFLCVFLAFSLPFLITRVTPAVEAIGLHRSRRAGPAQLLIDSGFSFTHVAPFIDGRLVSQARGMLMLTWHQ